jgi:hypothetical protein
MGVIIAHGHRSTVLLAVADAAEDGSAELGQDAPHAQGDGVGSRVQHVSESSRRGEGE